MMFILSVLATVILGIVACRIFARQLPSVSFGFLINAGLPIGIGISSILFIVFNLLGLPIFFTILFELGLVVFLYYKFLQSDNKIKQPLRKLNVFSLKEMSKNPVVFILSVFCFYSVIVSFGAFYFDSIKSPHGLWDAWADWNLGAKMIFRDPYGWPESFHRMISEDFHTDYPLLQKGFIARCWILLNNETVWIPIFFSFVFTFCTVGILSAGVSYFSNKTNGLLAGLILLCTPFFIALGDSQYADTTVGYFFLASIILLTMARKDALIRPDLLIGAGLAAGLSAWSKNEGLLFIVCLLCSQVSLLFFRNFKDVLSEIKYLVIGMLPVLLLITYQKIVISPPNQIMVAQGAQTIIKLKDVSRYLTVWEWYVDQFVQFGQWAFNPWWLFLGGLLYKGGINFRNYNYSFVANFTWLIMMLIGFFMVEIITPLDLVFYLSTSLHRLFGQLFPAFIFIYFISLKQGSLIENFSLNRTGKNVSYQLGFFRSKSRP